MLLARSSMPRTSESIWKSDKRPLKSVPNSKRSAPPSRMSMSSLKKWGKSASSNSLRLFREEVGDVRDQPVVVQDGVLGWHQEGEVVDGQDPAFGLLHYGIKGLEPFEQRGASGAVGEGQSGAGGLNRAGRVQGDVVKVSGDLVLHEVVDVDVPVVYVVLLNVVQVVGLEADAEPLRQAVDLAFPGRIAKQQELSPF